MAETGSAICKACGNGFISRLACATCSKIVPSGQAYCSGCAGRGMDPVRQSSDREHFPNHPGYSSAVRGGGALVPSSGHAREDDGGSVGLALPRLPPGISLERAHVAESRTGGRFGAIAEIQMGGNDAEILTKMNQVVALLHALAADMTSFVALSDGTRKIIKGCRNLAADLQEEVEIRVGSTR